MRHTSTELNHEINIRSAFDAVRALHSKRESKSTPSYCSQKAGAADPKASSLVLYVFHKPRLAKGSLLRDKIYRISEMDFDIRLLLDFS